ncbi:MAG: porin family protein [Bradyrhizobium sp.]|nr:porin family protein [Bradyrhizobium sp.]
MKKLLLGLSALVISAASASAADLAARPYVKAPPPAPIMSWTGFYAGINGGGAWTDGGTSMTYSDLANIGNTNNAYAPSTVNASASGGFGGVHAGYNWQFSPNWVIGIEGDWDWTNLKANGTNRLNTATVGTLLTDNAFLETKINWLASVRGRLGYASNNWLLYATGGVAFGDFDFNAAVHCTAVPASFCTPTGQDIRATGFSDTRVGGVVGGGFEFKPASNWTFGVEYLYYRFNHTNTGSGSWTFWNGTPAPFFACTTAGQNCARFSYGDVGLNTVRLRLSYQFNSPVVAKY